MEQIACKECTSPDCHGCNMYRLERMLMSGKLDALMDENRAIKMDADVRPGVRGKWTSVFDIGTVCNQCGYDIEEHGYDVRTDGEPNFCPNCGAWMGGS